MTYVRIGSNYLVGGGGVMGTYKHFKHWKFVGIEEERTKGY